jgi:hypothetical protein
MFSSQVKLARSISRALRVLILFPVVCLAVAGVPWGAITPAAASTATTWAYASGPHSLSADGTTWYLETTGGEPVGSHAAINVTLDRGSASAGVETHLWTFGGLPSSTIKNVATGKWTIYVSSGTLLKLSLTFVTTSKKAFSCSSGSEEQYTGSLKGVLWLNTGFTHVGKVGSSSISLGSSSVPNRFWVDKGCKLAKPPCPTVTGPGFSAGATSGSSNWSATGGPATSTKELVGVIRLTKLSTYVMRSDGGEQLEPRPTLGTTALTVATSTGMLSGKATLQKLYSPTKASQTCYTATGVKKTMTVESWPASFSSPSTLAAATLVTGKIKTGTSGYGSIMLLSLS